MAELLCIFEDKKFSNFLPLSLSQPVFELRVGFYNLRLRLQDEVETDETAVVCRDYLAPTMALRDPSVQVNPPCQKETVFLNGRLLCYGDELKNLLGRVPDNGMGVKGGYVVACRLGAEAAADFAAYISRRIADEQLNKLCSELKQGAGVGVAKRAKRDLLKEEPEEGGFEDEHLVGQDELAEKLPRELGTLIEKHGISLLDMSDARLLSFSWQIIEENLRALEDDFEKLPFRGQAEESVVYQGVHVVEEEHVVLGEGSVIKPGVVLDASEGPIVVADGAMVMPNATIVGPVYVGRGSIVKAGAKILGGTSIGDVCKIGGEVDGCIIAAYSNKQHEGFIGHSYIGEWVNIGAGSNNSDLKNNYSPVRMWCAGTMKPTGRQFLGLVMGDHTKTGINTMFNTGSVIGFNCNIYGSTLTPKFVPSFSWGSGEELTIYQLEKAMSTAAVVMERREIKFGKEHRALFEKIFELSKLSARNI